MSGPILPCIRRDPTPASCTAASAAATSLRSITSGGAQRAVSVREPRACDPGRPRGTPAAGRRRHDAGTEVVMPLSVRTCNILDPIFLRCGGRVESAGAGHAAIDSAGVGFPAGTLAGQPVSAITRPGRTKRSEPVFMMPNTNGSAARFLLKGRRLHLRGAVHAAGSGLPR